MYFETAQSYQICGAAVTTQDIPVNSGWNMIGAFDSPQNVNLISSTPAGILNPPVYEYDSGYLQSSVLNPGQGYWAYAEQSGTLHLGSGSSSAGTPMTPPTSSTGRPDNFRLPLTVSAGADSAMTVHIGVAPGGSDGYDAGLDQLAPPMPPPGAFDARLVGVGLDYLMDVRGTSETEQVFTLQYEAGSTGDSLLLAWDKEALASLGTFEILDMFGGELVRLDMSQLNELVIEPQSPLSQGLLIRFEPNPLFDGHFIYLPLILMD